VWLREKLERDVHGGSSFERRRPAGFASSSQSVPANTLSAPPLARDGARTPVDASERRCAPARQRKITANQPFVGTLSVSAPRETRTPTGHTAHKALNLADGVCAASAPLSGRVSVRGAGRYGRIWQGICYRPCYRAPWLS
jgi:hypothetical protein